MHTDIVNYCCICLLSSSSPSTLFGSTEIRPKIKSPNRLLQFDLILFFLFVILILDSCYFLLSLPLVLSSHLSHTLYHPLSNRHRLVRSLSFLFLQPLLLLPLDSFLFLRFFF